MQRNKLFKSEQIKYIDNFTIETEFSNSIDLMERAATNILAELMKHMDVFSNSFTIICGIGNNGGDGLALARLLSDKKVNVKAVFCEFSLNISPDCKKNLIRLKENYPDVLNIIHEENIDGFKIIQKEIIIDCLFGNGLNRPVTGAFGKIIDKINDSGATVISIDIPSGLFGEDNTGNYGSIIKADCTLTIQFPPISSMFAENYIYFGDVTPVDIGLSKNAIDEIETGYYLIDNNLVGSLLKKRYPFDHKGTYGHALLIMGSYGKGGAAVLGSHACMRSGTGLVTAHIPGGLVNVLQTAIPEVMVSADKNEKFFTHKEITENFTSMGIGPGLGTNSETEKAVLEILQFNKLPVVIDADALNILAKQTNSDKYFNKNTILTPHPKEFERLFGKFDNTWKKIEFMSSFSRNTGAVIILKGGISIISTSDGRIFFNYGCNPGMATGGSGDVLTGVIASLLAQGYNVDHAAILGAFIHSKAGEFAKNEVGYNALIASDIINNLGKAFIEIESLFDKRMN